MLNQLSFDISTYLSNPQTKRHLFAADIPTDWSEEIGPLTWTSIFKHVIGVYENTPTNMRRWYISLDRG